MFGFFDSYFFGGVFFEDFGDIGGYVSVWFSNGVLVYVRWEGYFVIFVGFLSIITIFLFVVFVI